MKRVAALANAGRVTVRAAAACDASAILRCLHEAFAPYCTQYTPAALEDTVLTSATITERLQRMTVLVAVDESGDVVGTLACSNCEREGHLRGMAVRPQWQGSGVAARLLAAAEDRLRTRACHHVTLDTTEPLKRAMRFYEKHGYRPTGTVSTFFGMPLCEYRKELRPARRMRRI
jgi:GNAT superfamily N-acetyltransferase